MVKGKCLKYYGIVGEKFLCITDLYFSMSFFSLWANVSTKHVSLHSLHKEALYGCCCFSFFLFSTAKEEQSRGIFGGNFQTRARDCNKAAGPEVGGCKKGQNPLPVARNGDIRRQSFYEYGKQCSQNLSKTALQHLDLITYLCIYLQYMY